MKIFKAENRIIKPNYSSALTMITGLIFVHFDLTFLTVMLFYQFIIGKLIVESFIYYLPIFAVYENYFLINSIENY